MTGHCCEESRLSSLIDWIAPLPDFPTKYNHSMGENTTFCTNRQLCRIGSQRDDRVIALFRGHRNYSRNQMQTNYGPRKRRAVRWERAALPSFSLARRGYKLLLPGAGQRALAVRSESSASICQFRRADWLYFGRLIASLVLGGARVQAHSLCWQPAFPFFSVIKRI